MLPRRAGVGFKPQHFTSIIEGDGAGFFEVHAENYMGEGGLPHVQLHELRERFPISLHGVGLSIGAEKALDPEHLRRLKKLVDVYKPESFSEHLAWSSHDDFYLNDLLPIAYNHVTLARVCKHICQVQDVLCVKMLLENPSTYLAFHDSDMSEVDFLREIVARTGCGMLLDVNNVFVSATNHGLDTHAYLKDFPLEAVGEIHLAGFSEDVDETGSLVLIDAHDSPVRDVVWGLYNAIIDRLGAMPTLIEWDNDVPAWEVLAGEMHKADEAMIKRGLRVAS